MTDTNLFQIRIKTNNSLEIRASDGEHSEVALELEMDANMDLSMMDTNVPFSYFVRESPQFDDWHFAHYGYNVTRDVQVDELHALERGQITELLEMYRGYAEEIGYDDSFEQSDATTLSSSIGQTLDN